MHVLLTRNLEDSKILIQKFKSNGFKVSNLPLLEINKVNYNETKINNFNDKIILCIINKAWIMNI